MAVAQNQSLSGIKRYAHVAGVLLQSVPLAGIEQNTMSVNVEPERESVFRQDALSGSGIFYKHCDTGHG
jgi:hypothetical protein